MVEIRFCTNLRRALIRQGPHVRASIRSKRGPATADNKVVSHGDQLKRHLGPETKLVGRKESFYHFAQLTDPAHKLGRIGGGLPNRISNGVMLNL